MALFFQTIKTNHSLESDYSLEDAFINDLKNIQHESVLLVNDGTIFFDLYERALRKRDKPFEVLDLSDFQHAISENHKQTCVLILPVFEFRIFNLNYDRIAGKELCKPYLVYIESSRFHILKSFLEKKFSKVLVNPLIEMPSLLHTYLTHKELLKWLQSEDCPEPHNDRTERRIVSTTDSLYKKDSLLGSKDIVTFALEQTKISHPVTYKHYPVHRIYQKYLNIELPVNLIERELYGTVFL